MIARVLAALALLLLAGCLRVGPGEDLHLVCEEKSASPRRAYGIDFLVAQTQVNASPPLSSERTLALLEAARGHVITPRGAAHVGFRAELTDARPIEGGDGTPRWLFHGVGVWDDAPQDDYWVRLSERDGRITAAPDEGPGPVQAPRTLQDSAWRAVNATPTLAARLDQKPYVEWAAWDPELPSCVRVRVVDVEDAAEVVVNVAQGRVVHVA